MRLYGQTLDYVDPQQAAKYEDDAGRYWDLFYKRNSDRFFKDRHYFDKEWPQLTAEGPLTVLEVGCGAGNSVFPLLDLNPDLRVYACDFSPRAVELVKAHPQYAATGRVTAFVADITQHEGPGALSHQLPGPCADYCSMVFVLSAVAPHRMRQALRNVASVLKPGSGHVLFRDYAEGDLAQTRLEDSSGVKHMYGNFYARGDGTCCYYFDQDELSALFAAEGFICEASVIHARTLENRKSGVKMPRRWIQAVFRYDPLQQPPQPLPLTPATTTQQQQLQSQQPQQQPAMQAASGEAQAVQHAGAAEASSVSSSSSDSSRTVECAGKAWLVPCDLLPPSCCRSRNGDTAAAAGDDDGSSSSSSASCCCVCLMQALSALVEQQAVQLLGQCVLLLPPWLRLSAPQQQQQQQQQGQVACACECPAALLHVQEQGAQPPTAYCCSGGSNNSTSTATDARQRGAAVALLALLAVWHGAKRVYVCLPGGGAGGGSGQGQQQQCGSSSSVDEQTTFAAAFHAVVALNECSVVVERICTKQWPQDSSARRVGVLSRELVGVGSAEGVVVLAQQAASDCCGGLQAAPAEVQQLVGAVCSSVQCRKVQVVLVGQSTR